MKLPLTSPLATLLSLSVILTSFLGFEVSAQTAVSTSDPYFTGGAQWYLNKIQANTAWALPKGSSDIIVAVVDTGVDANHPDLAGKVLTHLGYDFVNNDTDASDDHGHGTAAAGLISPVSNNGVGIAGVSWNAKILPVKVLNASKLGTTTNIAKGIKYAADNGADIINVSASIATYSQAIADAVDYAWNKGSVIIASAGNYGTSAPAYPASLPNVVSVAATTYNDTLATFSNYGSSITVAAPGAGIISLTKGGSYKSWNGTSFSAPLVAGVASLIASSSNVTTNQQVVDILKASADDIGTAGIDNQFGHGRVNADAAVKATLLASSPTPEAEVKVAPSVEVLSVSANTITVKVSVEAGESFTFECSEDMENWSILHAGNGTGATQTLTLPFTNDNCGFFQVVTK